MTQPTDPNPQAPNTAAPAAPPTTTQEQMREQGSKTDGRRVRVVSGALGSSPSYTQGQIVPASEFPDVDHLLEIGAVVETDEEDAPGPSLFEAMRSESPPTLPNAPYVDATEREKLSAAGALPTETVKPEETQRG